MNSPPSIMAPKRTLPKANAGGGIRKTRARVGARAAVVRRVRVPDNPRVSRPRTKILQGSTQAEVASWPRNNVLLFLDNLPDGTAAEASQFQSRLDAAAQEAIDSSQGPVAVVTMSGDPPIGPPRWDRVFANTEGG